VSLEDLARVLDTMKTHSPYIRGTEDREDAACPYDEIKRKTRSCLYASQSIHVCTIYAYHRALCTILLQFESTSVPNVRVYSRTPAVNHISNTKNGLRNTTDLAVSHASASPSVCTHTSTSLLCDLSTDIASPPRGAEVRIIKLIRVHVIDS